MTIYPENHRQMQVLQLVAWDCPLKEVARKLRISVKTVEYHWANLRRVGITTPIKAFKAWRLVKLARACERRRRLFYNQDWYNQQISKLL
jgi:Response regulator containing a CheY-like receiver domain and an HTH DNA-binding domain